MIEKYKELKINIQRYNYNIDISNISNDEIF